MKKTLKLAVISLSISHFEVPMFRLCKNIHNIDLKVFYLLPIKNDKFDTEYKQNINWGDNLLEGYANEQCNSAEDLRQSALEWGADVLLLYGYSWKGAIPIILKNRIEGIPQIHRGTLNYYLDPRRPIIGRLMRPWRSIIFRLFQAHHYGGSYSRRVLSAAGVKDKEMFMIPYSVDTPFFVEATSKIETQQAASNFRQSLGWSEQDHVMLFIAQHNWFKGPDIVMEVFKKWQETDPRARLLILGSGTMTDSMISFAKEKLVDNSYCFVGFVPSKETTKYYLASDLVICTSRYETWARMINEAMICGKVCLINQKVPAAGGLINDRKNGFVVKEGDVEDYVDAVSRYFSLSVNEQHEMQQAAIKNAKDFSYEKYMNEFVACVQYAWKATRKGS